jgi:hypothetical protein
VKGTMMRIGLEGKVCALAAQAKSVSNATSASYMVIPA